MSSRESTDSAQGYRCVSYSVDHWPRGAASASVPQPHRVVRRRRLSLSCNGRRNVESRSASLFAGGRASAFPGRAPSAGPSVTAKRSRHPATPEQLDTPRGLTSEVRHISEFNQSSPPAASASSRSTPARCSVSARHSSRVATHGPSARAPRRYVPSASHGMRIRTESAGQEAPLATRKWSSAVDDERTWADHQNGLSFLAHLQLFQDQARLDRLADTDVVSHKNPRTVRLHQLEDQSVLVVLKVDATGVARVEVVTVLIEQQRCRQSRVQLRRGDDDPAGLVNSSTCSAKYRWTAPSRKTEHRVLAPTVSTATTAPVISERATRRTIAPRPSSGDSLVVIVDRSTSEIQAQSDQLHRVHWAP